MPSCPIASTSSTPGAVIRYTLDGSTPTSASPVYAGPIAVSSSLTIKAYASATGMTDSPVASASYTLTVGNGAFSQGVSELGATATVWFKPAAAQRFAERGAGRGGLRACVDHARRGRGLLHEPRHEAPAQQVDLAVVGAVT